MAMSIHGPSLTQRSLGGTKDSRLGETSAATYMCSWYNNCRDDVMDYSVANIYNTTRMKLMLSRCSPHFGYLSYYYDFT